MFNNVVAKNIKSYKQRYTFKKLLKNISFISIIVLILFIWIQAINALILIAIVIGSFTVILLRGLIGNITAYFVIRRQNYFKIGDRVEVDDVIGDVMDINPISFKLLEVRSWLSSDSNTGRVIQIPNSIIFDQDIKIVEARNTFIWHEINYTLSFDSNWQKAEKIMISVADAYFNEKLFPTLKDHMSYLSDNPQELKPVFH